MGTEWVALPDRPAGDCDRACPSGCADRSPSDWDSVSRCATRLQACSSAGMGSGAQRAFEGEEVALAARIV